jgi:hypothetical protein
MEYLSLQLAYYVFINIFPRAVDLGGESPKLLSVAAWQLLNQLVSEILLRFPFVMGRHKAGLYCPNIWHSPIPVWQLPESLLAGNLLNKQHLDTAVKTLPK